MRRTGRRHVAATHGPTRLPAVMGPPSSSKCRPNSTAARSEAAMMNVAVHHATGTKPSSAAAPVGTQTAHAVRSGA